VRLGHVLGALAFRGEVRRISLENLQLALGNADERIGRASLQNFVATVLGLFWARRLTRENFRQFVEIDEPSLARAREVFKRGKGLVFATLHFGDWELLGLTTALVGLPLTIVQEAMRNRPLQELLSRLRGATGHTVIAQEMAVTKLFRVLRNGGATALLVDLGTTRRGRGIWLDFFGLPVFSSPAFAALALRSGAPVLFAYALPLPDGRARLVYGPEITGRDMRELAQNAYRLCEDLIRRHPEFWWWSYKRWSPRPTESQGRYPSYSRPLPKRGKFVKQNHDGAIGH
jgi:KDO2-lipid IV(A) lauroyltransferase